MEIGDFATWYDDALRIHRAQQEAIARSTEKARKRKP